jgi:hypothetical protein
MEVWVWEMYDGWEFSTTTWSSYEKAYEALAKWADNEFEIKESIAEPGNYEYSLSDETGETNLWVAITLHILDKN